MICTWCSWLGWRRPTCRRGEGSRCLCVVLKVGCAQAHVREGGGWEEGAWEAEDLPLKGAAEWLGRNLVPLCRQALDRLLSDLA